MKVTVSFIDMKSDSLISKGHMARVEVMEIEGARAVWDWGDGVYVQVYDGYSAYLLDNGVRHGQPVQSLVIEKEGWMKRRKDKAEATMKGATND